MWHTLSADRVLEAEEVDEQSGLSSAEAASRAERFGPNKFDAGTAEPRWRVFIRHYTDLMQLVLLVAGLVRCVLAVVSSTVRSAVLLLRGILFG